MKITKWRKILDKDHEREKKGRKHDLMIFHEREIIERESSIIREMGLHNRRGMLFHSLRAKEQDDLISWLE